MKKWIAILLAMTMLLGLLTGCGDSESPETTQSQTEDTATLQTQTQATEEKREETQMPQTEGLDGKKVLFVGDSFLSMQWHVPSVVALLFM